ncbi:hypothetical protein BH09BAC1_BH09BAC1_23290 [soil metagenome]
MRNKISYLAFKEQLSPFRVFSLRDVTKVYPVFASNRFSEWQSKGYITKLIKGWYIFNDVPTSETTLFQISNALCRPSYVSLESALSFYGAIPEQAFTITSITTTKTRDYTTPRGRFTYQVLKPSLYFGYRILPQVTGRAVLMAELEKTLLDYLYLNPKLNCLETIEALRLNREVMQTMDKGKMEAYLSLFNNKALEKRYEVLKQHLQW